MVPNRKDNQAPYCSPFWTGPLAISMHFHEQLRGVSRWGDTCVEQKVFVLSQVLGWGLLGGPSTVQQFSLQQGQVGLGKKRQGLGGRAPGAGPHTAGPGTQKAFADKTIKTKVLFSFCLIFSYASVSNVTSITLNRKGSSLVLTKFKSPKEENVLSSPLWPNTELNRAQQRFVEHNNLKLMHFWRLQSVTESMCLHRSRRHSLPSIITRPGCSEYYVTFPSHSLWELPGNSGNGDYSSSAGTRVFKEKKKIIGNDCNEALD